MPRVKFEAPASSVLSPATLAFDPESRQVVPTLLSSSGDENSSLGRKVKKSGDRWKKVGITCYALLKPSFRGARVKGGF